MSVGDQSLKSPTTCARAAPDSAGMRNVTSTVRDVDDGCLRSAIVRPLLLVIGAHDSDVLVDAGELEHPTYRRARIQQRNGSTSSHRSRECPDAGRVEKRHVAHVEDQTVDVAEGEVDCVVQVVASGEIDLALERQPNLTIGPCDGNVEAARLGRRFGHHALLVKASEYGTGWFRPMSV